MSLKDLLELAHLDALGLLDEDDQRRFERAFVAAPPALKDQVRAEQARWADMDPILPRVEPPADLRDRVLAAVEQAMIRDVALGDSMGDDIFPAHRVSSHWRTGAVALLSVLVIFVGAFSYVYSINDRMREAINQNTDANRYLATWGTSDHLRDSLFEPGVVHSYFHPVDETITARASIYVSKDWTTNKLFVEGLPSPQGATLRVCVVDEKNNVVREVASFTSDGSLTRCDLPGTLGNGTRVAILAAPRGMPASAASATLLMIATIG